MNLIEFEQSIKDFKIAHAISAHVKTPYGDFAIAALIIFLRGKFEQENSLFPDKGKDENTKIDIEHDKVSKQFDFYLAGGEMPPVSQESPSNVDLIPKNVENAIQDEETVVRDLPF